MEISEYMGKKKTASLHRRIPNAKCRRSERNKDSPSECHTLNFCGQDKLMALWLVGHTLRRRGWQRMRRLDGSTNLRDMFTSVQLLSCIWLFATPWTTTCQASLSITNTRSPPKLMSIELVIPSNHLILCRLLLLLPSIFPSIRVFSNESVLHMVAKVLEFQFQHQSFQWIFRTDFL